MPAKYNDKISSEVRKKIAMGCRAQVKALANHYRKTTKYASDDYIAGLNTALEVAKIERNLAVAVYDCKECFVFDLEQKTEDEWLEKIVGTFPGPSKPASEKVVAKMALLRIVKVMKFVGWNLNGNRLMKEDKEKVRSLIPVRTVKGLEELCRVSYMWSHSETLSKSVLEFCGRRDVTDQAISDAWDMYQVSQVQNA